jgi:hypothetical protein
MKNEKWKLRRLHKQVYNFTVNLMNAWPLKMITDLKGRCSIFSLTLAITKLPQRGKM